MTELVERYFAAINARDWKALAVLLHPDISVRHGSLLAADGVTAVITLYQKIVGQFPKGAHEDRPTRILVSGDMVAAEITATVARPDGASLTFPALDVIDVDRGLIRKVSTWYDTAVVVPWINDRKDR